MADKPVNELAWVLRKAMADRGLDPTPNEPGPGLRADGKLPDSFTFDMIGVINFQGTFDRCDVVGYESGFDGAVPTDRALERMAKEFQKVLERHFFGIESVSCDEGDLLGANYDDECPRGGYWMAGITALKDDGFQGFVQVSDLWAQGCDAGRLPCPVPYVEGGYVKWGAECDGIPDVPGVYVIVRPDTWKPEWLGDSPAYRFKGREPAVGADVLDAAWVDGAQLVYVGKAGGKAEAGSRAGGATLRSRLRAFMRFGAGKSAAHRGGRYIWQIADCADLLVAWKPTPGIEPREVERQMLEDFHGIHQKLPFANLKR